MTQAMAIKGNILVDVATRQIRLSDFLSGRGQVQGLLVVPEPLRAKCGLVAVWPTVDQELLVLFDNGAGGIEKAVILHQNQWIRGVQELKRNCADTSADGLRAIELLSMRPTNVSVSMGVADILGERCNLDPRSLIDEAPSALVSLSAMSRPASPRAGWF